MFIPRKELMGGHVGRPPPSSADLIRGFANAIYDVCKLYKLYPFDYLKMMLDFEFEYAKYGGSN